jgi:hypothetical protein
MISIEIIGGKWLQVQKIKNGLSKKLKDLKNCRIVTSKGMSSVKLGQKKEAPFLRVTWQKNDNLYCITKRLQEEEKQYGIHIMPSAFNLEDGKKAYLD